MNPKPFILVGGRSTRFGVDKATYEFEGETLAERAARIAEAALEPESAVFVAAAEKAFPNFGGRTVIHDIFRDRGAAGAVHSALSNARSDWIFVLASDLPFVSAEFITFLRRHLDEGSDAVVPIQEDGRWQPLCSFFKVSSCLPLLGSVMNTSGKHTSFRDLLLRANTLTVPFPAYRELAGSARFLRNVNTIDDLVFI